ncbi:MAG: DUF4349 domain-containing protein [Planctomycetaceae bacterium]|nr:DUF4349 domain-containing protein [Planctomycetaceae bacterium]
MVQPIEVCAARRDVQDASVGAIPTRPVGARSLPFRCAALIGLAALLGCGGAHVGSDTTPLAHQATQPVAYVQQNETASDTQRAVDRAAPDPVAPTDRKIIYHAFLQIDVVNFSDAAAGVESIVSRHGGFVATSRLGGRSGSTRSGQWTLRVPVERYRSLVNDLGRLGELREQHETSNEVTAEFFDLQARIRNKQQEEQRLLKHLDETTRQLPEILTIERELSRVRGEVEQMQGRLKMLADQTSLSTVEVTIAETVPFVTAETPTFGARVERAWVGSTGTLLALLMGLAILATVFFPWIAALGVIVAVVLPIVVLFRRRSRIPAA